jgi:hypothetical protein
LRILQIPHVPKKTSKNPPRFWVFPSRPSDIMGFGAPFGVIPFHTVGALGEKAMRDAKRRLSQRHFWMTRG